MDEWEVDVGCHRCGDRGCAKCEPLDDLERERRAPSQLPADTTQGPSRTYAEWVQSRSCGDKRGYGHQLDARQAILSIAQRGGPDMTEYRCPHCNLWHLTSQVEEAS
jgi:hypothetical protein